MKTIILKISTGLMFLISLAGYAQNTSKPFMDSVFIRIENRMEITLSTYDVASVKEQFRNDLSRLGQILMLDSARFEDYESYSIEYVPQKKLTIELADKKEMIVFDGDKLKSYIYKNRCNIHSEAYHADIRFVDIDDITDVSNHKAIMQTFDSLPDKDRWAFSYHFDVVDGTVIPLRESDHQNGMMDALSLNFSVGAGVIKNKLVTDVTAEIGLQFSKKGLWRNRYYVSDNLFYLFDENGNIRYNNFMNIGYRYNFSRNPEKTNWFGVELGYLTNRQGDFFDKDTFRVGVNWDIGRYLSISPSLYISDNFNRVIPGIRLGIGF